MSSFGSFTLIKNESRWIRAHLLSWLPYVNQMVFFDGNSTDGTLAIIKDVADNHPFGNRITLVEDMDPADLDQDYQAVFNECLRTLKTDYAAFIHPDMILDTPGNIGFLGDAICYTMNVRSFAGDPGGKLYEIVRGRESRWKNIYRLHKPDLGLHYFGAYGSANEDCYFSKITGDVHDYHKKIEDYPYEIKDSGIHVLHYSDVRDKSRRVDRMVKCLVNQGFSLQRALEVAPTHPRVNFQNSPSFEFIPAEYPEHLKEIALV